MENTDGHATPKEAAQILRLAEQTLANLRHRGRGPRYVKRGLRVLYPHEALAEYAAKRKPTRKTTTD